MFYWQCVVCEENVDSPSIESVQGQKVWWMERHIRHDGHVCVQCLETFICSNPWCSMIKYRIEYWEYERGWGSRLDSTQDCDIEQEAIDRIRKFNAQNTDSIAPDWYMVAKGPYKVELPDSIPPVVPPVQNVKVIRKKWISRFTR